MNKVKKFLTRLYWKRAFQKGGIHTWMHESVVRRYINSSITGNPNEWPLEWFKRLYVKEPFLNALSMGCGDGALERDLRGKNICKRVTGIDISSDVIDMAQEKARSEGIDNIHYKVGDMNGITFPPSEYDIVFFHHSLHHVKMLKECLQQVKNSMKEGAILYLDEYAGPSRDGWNHEQMSLAYEVFRKLPDRVKRERKLKYPIDRWDPSEAVRSSEIVSTVRSLFTDVTKYDYGGNLLAIIYPYLTFENVDRDEKELILKSIIQEERRLLDRGAASFNSILISQQ